MYTFTLKKRNLYNTEKNYKQIQHDLGCIGIKKDDNPVDCVDHLMKYQGPNTI